LGSYYITQHHRPTKYYMIKGGRLYPTHPVFVNTNIFLHFLSLYQKSQICIEIFSWNQLNDMNLSGQVTTRWSTNNLVLWQKSWQLGLDPRKYPTAILTHLNFVEQVGHSYCSGMDAHAGDLLRIFNFSISPNLRPCNILSNGISHMQIDFRDVWNIAH